MRQLLRDKLFSYMKLLVKNNRASFCFYYRFPTFCLDLAILRKFLWAYPSTLTLSIEWGKDKEIQRETNTEKKDIETDRKRQRQIIDRKTEKEKDRERERQRQRKTETEKDRDRKRERKRGRVCKLLNCMILLCVVKLFPVEMNEVMGPYS